MPRRRRRKYRSRAHRLAMKLANEAIGAGKFRSRRRALKWAWKEVRKQLRGKGDKKKAEQVMRRRSKRAVTLDKKKKARVPLDFETWTRRPGRYDWPGVDMPESSETKARVGKRKKEPEMLLVVQRKHHDKGIKIRHVELHPRGATIEERRVRDYVYISLAHVKKDVEFRESASGRGFGLLNIRTGKIVWFPARLVRARKTYLAMPVWLYEKKKNDLKKAGFMIEEQ